MTEPTYGIYGDHIRTNANSMFSGHQVPRGTEGEIQYNRVHGDDVIYAVKLIGFPGLVEMRRRDFTIITA
jgi:hypothetical protein